MEKTYLTVEEFNNYLKTLLSEEELLYGVPVMGEASNVSVVSGHCYFNLKDKNACIAVCCFNCKKTHVPVNGEKLLVVGTPDLYVKTGKLSIIASSIELFGLGKLYRELEELKARLTEEGLFLPEHKKPIPQYPKKVGVITSLQGAAIQDILTTVKRKNAGIDLTLIDVRVQGVEAAKDIVKVMKKIDKLKLDVVILGRGGGSFEDLYCFNDEALIRAVYEVKTPVVSAVGHETDFTLLDFVSDYRAITPTAAAELVAFDMSVAKENLSYLVFRAKENVENKYREYYKTLENKLKNLENYRKTFVSIQKMKIKMLAENFKSFFEKKVETENARLKEFLYMLENASPVKVLQKGYFKVESKGSFISGVSELEVGDKVILFGNDGKAEGVITEKIINKNEVGV